MSNLKDSTVDVIEMSSLITGSHTHWLMESSVSDAKQRGFLLWGASGQTIFNLPLGNINNLEVRVMLYSKQEHWYWFVKDRCQWLFVI